MRYMKRDPFTITSQILYCALGGQRKTSLANSCNLSTKICEKYFAILLRKGLLEKKGDHYSTTEKGKRFLATYQKLDLIWST